MTEADIGTSRIASKPPEKGKQGRSLLSRFQRDLGSAEFLILDF